jgi:hypothetical protein
MAGIGNPRRCAAPTWAPFRGRLARSALVNRGRLTHDARSNAPGVPMVIVSGVSRVGRGSGVVKLSRWALAALCLACFGCFDPPPVETRNAYVGGRVLMGPGAGLAGAHVVVDQIDRYSKTAEFYRHIGETDTDEQGYFEGLPEASSVAFGLLMPATARSTADRLRVDRLCRPSTSRIDGALPRRFAALAVGKAAELLRWPASIFVRNLHPGRPTDAP